jgi:hypothetical protein
MDIPIDYTKTLNYEGISASMYTDPQFFPDTDRVKTEHNINRYLRRKWSQQVSADYVLQHLWVDQPIWIRLEAIKMIQYCAEGERERLRQILSNQNINTVDSWLYPDTTDFRLQNKQKTGSLLTLLWDKTWLTHQVIKRTIPYDSFLLWQQAYEQSQAWHGAWFEYIPLEPIIDFSKPYIQTISIDDHDQTNIRIDAYTQVLDCNLWQRAVHNTRYLQELITQKQKILDTIDTLSINHGHSHDGNFCLRFARHWD